MRARRVALERKKEAIMADLVCVAFDDPTTADRALTELTALQKEYLIELKDACVVVRSPDGEVHLHQAMPLVKTGALTGGTTGALWGTLIGLLFLNPLAGMALGAGFGAASGALAGKLTDYGIPDDFIKQLGQQVRNQAVAPSCAVVGAETYVDARLTEIVDPGRQIG